MESRKPRRPKMGPRGVGAPADKAKDFKGTLKRLIKYIGRYNIAIIVVFIVLILATVLSVMSPKVLGKATTELGNNVIERIVYNQINEMLKEAPSYVVDMLPEDALVKASTLLAL